MQAMPSFSWNWFRFLLLSSFILLFTGCGAGKKVVKLNKIKKNPSSAAIIQHLTNQRLDAEGMEAKASVKYKDGYFSMSGTLNIKIRKDSLIWLSIRKFGFEAVRVQITSDSIQILDRLNNEYSVYPLTYIEKEYSLPADFKVLESIFYGNPVFLGSKKFQLDLTDPSTFQLSNPSSERFVTQITLNRENLCTNATYYRDQLEPDRSVNIAFDKYSTIDKKDNFSYFRILDISQSRNEWMKLTVNFSKVEFEKPNRIRFDVPEKYTRN